MGRVRGESIPPTGMFSSKGCQEPYTSPQPINREPDGIVRGGRQATQGRQEREGSQQTSKRLPGVLFGGEKEQRSANQSGREGGGIRA